MRTYFRRPRSGRDAACCVYSMQHGTVTQKSSYIPRRRDAACCVSTMTRPRPRMIARNLMQPTSPDGSVWHEGELAVQRRAGVQTSGRGIRSSIPEGLIGFLTESRLVIFASVDSERRAWASLRVSEPGFLCVIDPLTLETEPADLDGDLLLTNLKQNPDVGMLIIDLATRRRIRINGEAEILSDNGLRIHARQVYGNCPQYIQLRVSERAPLNDKPPSLISRATQLSPSQHEWIAQADTLFIASAHPEHGVDASHR
ncbi:MAG: hypothetical protein DMG60_15345 [Acidobacteria bacterium]|nr:MAG: hypothetical protein DMG60_15345 [Acidobacteriota bacterium]